MPQFGQFWRKLMFLLQRKRLERELEEEMRLHAQMKTEKNLAAGMDEQEARYAAQRQLGNSTRQREESRQSWGFPLLESVVQDLRYGWRGLRKSPAFTAVAIITLGLGIGAATCIFSIVNAVLLRPLPYKDSSRIVNLFTVSAMFPEFDLGQSIPNLTDIKTRARSFETIATYALRSLTLTGADEPQQIGAAAISANFLDLFGIHPVLGRSFVPDDEQQKNGNVALLSYGLWNRRFGADAAVLGKTITLDQKPYTVIGILPAGFDYPPSYDDRTEVWIPLVVKPEDQRNRTSWGFFTLAKLRPDVPLHKAQSEMDGIAAAIAHEYPKEASGIRFPVITIQAWTVERGKSELLVLLAAVAFLLLIACANVSNLVLSRGLQRQREIAVRAALGASHRRILRQLFLESLLLSLLGGAVGLTVAVVGLKAFRAFAPAQFPRLAEIQLEPVIAVFALLISGIASLLCGLVPSLFASRSDLNATMKRNLPAAAAHDGGFSFRGFLVVAEVALTLILLTGSALMVESLVRLLKVDPGLRIDHMVMAELRLSSTRYGSEEAQRVFVRQLFDSLRAQPQFSGVALSNNSILNSSTALTTFDPSLIGINEKPTNLEARSVSPGYFETMGIALLRGRSFTDRDVHGSLNVTVINESLARRFFPGKDPIGKLIKFSPDQTKDQYQIVGVVADSRDIQISAGPRPQVYFPLLQDAYTGVHILVRSRLDPAAATGLLQKCVWSIDKDQPIRKVRSMSQVISGSIAEPRFRTWLLTAFAGVGLTLTLIGIYGVISYSVSQRTHEMGIRIALGAQPQNVLRLVLRDGVRLTLLGGAIGILGSLLLTRLLQSQLYDTKPGDPVTLAGAALLMLLVAVGASYIPARRATMVDPMIALRYE